MLGVLLGTALKFEGRFILQTKTDGPVPMLVVDFTTPDKVRACARFDKDRVAEAIAAGKTDAGALLGRGHLAMTIDQGGDMSRYQGLVALEGGTLEDAAHEYFLRSEQIPTRVRLAVAEEFRAASGGAEPSLARRRHAAAVRAARAGARARARSRSGRCAGRHRRRTSSPEDDAWVEGRSLIETVEDIELIDPAVSSERLLYRLFHERGVRVFRSDRTDRAVLLLARERRGDAALVPAGRPRRHGGERRDLGDLRVLQRRPTCSSRRRWRTARARSVDRPLAPPGRRAKRSGSRCRTARRRPTPCRSCRS